MPRARAALALGVFLASIAAGCATIDRYLPSFLQSPSTGDPIPLRTIAILPFAYRGPDSRRDCDVCPNPLVMSETSAETGLLITAFFYEALGRYPRFNVIPFETVEGYHAETMDEMLVDLTRDYSLDGVLVGGVLEMRRRTGDPRSPSRTGGAAIYAALLDVGTGEPVWAQFFDGTKYPPNFILKTYESVVATSDDRRPTAEEVAEYGIQKMVKSMARAVR